MRRIGGGEVVVTSLIGPDSDAHVFEPNPDQARLLAKAQLFVVNGLGFEGWLTRLTRSAQFGGVVVTATDGVAPITTTEPGETSPVPDPHAWQDPRNGIIYADNIARALAAVDPAHADGLSPAVPNTTKPSSRRWTAGCARELAEIPADKRRVITSHDAFAYYGKAYGVTFLAAEGLSTDSEPSAKTLAAIDPTDPPRGHQGAVSRKHLGSAARRAARRETPARFRARRSIPTRCRVRTDRPRPTSG